MDHFERTYLERYGFSCTVSQYLCYIIGLYAPRALAKILFKIDFQRNLDLNAPKDLNEKINYLAFNTNTVVWSLLTDKLFARKYVAMQGYRNILTKLYGVWGNVNSINFETLPKSFVIKCNHDSGSAYIVLDKTTINRDEIIATLKKRIQHPYGIVSAEPHYRRIKRLVFAEELIPHQNNTFDGPINYKFWCFYGDVAYCHIQYRLHGINGAEVYRLPQWQYHPNALVNNDDSHIINAPAQLNAMMNIAANLSRNFPQCRVDLYESGERIFFGELTFTAGCGRINDYTKAFLRELGDRVATQPVKRTINGVKSYGAIQNKYYMTRISKIERVESLKHISP